MIRLFRENRPLAIYFMIIALTALGLSLSNDVLHNYFKDVYNVSAFQRGLIELPRESPGVLLIFIVAGLSFMTDIRMSMVAQVLSAIGIIALGLFTPTYGIMLLLIFINSLGMHLFFPLTDSIGLSLVDASEAGKRMGQFKGATTGFMMIGYGIVFLGFRTGIFSFMTDVKVIFLLAGSLFLVVFGLLYWLEKSLGHGTSSEHKVKVFFRKEYRYYYVLVIMFGVQKQMMMVYGPWVFIEILGKGPDTMAMLAMGGAFVGVFFLPAVGRWMDRFGVKKLLYADAISFIAVYYIYGLVSGGLNSGWIPKAGIAVFFLYGLFIIDRMSTQLGMVRSVYLKSILVEPKDLTPTLSLGISLDHIMSITFAILSGYIWSAWGPQYIFYLVGTLSFVNLFVAVKVKVV